MTDLITDNWLNSVMNVSVDILVRLISLCNQNIYQWSCNNDWFKTNFRYVLYNNIYSLQLYVRVLPMHVTSTFSINKCNKQYVFDE